MAPAELPPFDEAAAIERWRTGLFRPPRARLEEALGVPDAPDRAPPGLSSGAWRAWRETRQSELAREHWENMVARGLVPHAWLDDESRCFLGTRAVHRPASGSASTTFVPALFAHPPTPDAVIAYASDAPKVLACEQLAREAWSRVQRFEPSEKPMPRVLWNFSSDEPEHRRFYGQARDVTPSILAEAMIVAFFSPERWDDWDLLSLVPENGSDRWSDIGPWGEFAVLNDRLDGMLARARDLDLPWGPQSFPGNERSGTNALFRSFGEISESPYEPVLDLLRRGYGFVGEDAGWNALRIEAVLP